jgi:hypothetical protein
MVGSIPYSGPWRKDASWMMVAVVPRESGQLNATLGYPLRPTCFGSRAESLTDTVFESWYGHQNMTLDSLAALLAGVIGALAQLHRARRLPST